MKIGYARVSSTSQDLELQQNELLKAGCKKIFSELVSAKNNDRIELNRMLNELRENDVVVVYKIDIIARSLKGLIEIAEILKSKKVELVSLDSLDKVDTTSPMGNAFFQMTGVFAELERRMINERTRAGIEEAKKNGIKFGRPKVISKKTLQVKDSVIELLETGKMSSKKIASLLNNGICQPTILKIAAQNNLMWMGKHLGWQKRPT